MKRAYQMILPVALALVSACSILPKADPANVYRAIRRRCWCATVCWTVSSAMAGWRS